MTVSVQTTRCQIQVQSMITGFTHLQRGTSDDQCPVSYPQFAVLWDTCQGPTSEQVVVFRH